MVLAIKIALLVVFIGVSAAIVVSVIFFFRPVATTFWLRRLSLRQTGFRKTTIATTVGRQTTWQGGTGPSLVLLHGAGDQAGTWNRIAPALKAHFHLIMPDLAGHGESEPTTGVLRLGTLLTALEQVLDTTPWRGVPIVLAGNSLGAWMAMLYASKHPQKVTRVILIDGGPIRHASQIGIMPKDREEARRTLDAVLDPSTPHRPSFVLDDLVRVANTGPISRLLAAGEGDLSKYLLEDRLEGFQIPVDLVWGASDRLVSLDYAKKLQAQLPHCSLTVIERCGHGPQLEQPRELTRVLLEILATDASPGKVAVGSASEGPGENR